MDVGKNSQSVTVEFYISDIVLREREHQIIQDIQNRLEPIRGDSILNELVSHANLSYDNITERARLYIEEQLKDSGVRVCGVDYEALDWQQITSLAVTHTAPFRTSAEKPGDGFRDTMIMMAFIQHGRQEENATSEHILLSDDTMLRDGTEREIAGANHWHCVKNISDLASLIASFEHDLTPEEFANVTENAWVALQSTEGEKLRADIEAIVLHIPSVLEALKKKDIAQENTAVSLKAPTFVSRDGSSYTWRILVKFEASRFGRPEIPGESSKQRESWDEANAEWDVEKSCERAIAYWDENSRPFPRVARQEISFRGTPIAYVTPYPLIPMPANLKDCFVSKQFTIDVIAELGEEGFTFRNVVEDSLAPA